MQRNKVDEMEEAKVWKDWSEQSGYALFKVYIEERIKRHQTEIEELNRNPSMDNVYKSGIIIGKINELQCILTRFRSKRKRYVELKSAVEIKK